MGKMISVDEARAHLSRLLERASQGEDIVIAENGKPLARLVPVAPATTERKPGLAKGEFALPDAFFDALPDDELSAWER